MKTSERYANLTDKIFVVEVFIQDFKLHHGNIRNGNVKHHFVVPLINVADKDSLIYSIIDSKYQAIRVSAVFLTSLATLLNMWSKMKQVLQGYNRCVLVRGYFEPNFHI